MNLDSIPAELRGHNRWCTWRAVPSGGGKVRKQPWKGLAPLKWRNGFELISFSVACEQYATNPGLYAGIGFVLPPCDDDGARLVCIDLDHAIGDDGILTSGAKEIIRRLDSYTEISPSGKGVHVWILASNLAGAKNIPQRSILGQTAEAFVGSHFVTVTGDMIEGCQPGVEDRSTAFTELFGKLDVGVTAVQPRRAERYVERALENAAKRVSDASEGTRNDTLNKQACSIGRFVPDYLSEGEVTRALLRAAKSSGLGEDEAMATIRSGLGAGKKHPEDPKLKDDVKKAESPITVNPVQCDPVIHDVAMDILKNGDPVQYVIDACSRMALGADSAFRKLICCVAVQGVRSSMGLHPKLSGGSGGGKTWIITTFAHHLPQEMVLAGSTSALAGYYHHDGDKIFRILDDYVEGNDLLDATIKRTSSMFHLRCAHRTIVKGEPKTFEIGSEQTWAITSIDSSEDVQVLNRQIQIAVDDSTNLTEKVNRATMSRYARGEVQYPLDDVVEVCREIFRILRADGDINVRIPFADRIEWLDNTNRRNPSIFMDLLVGHTSMRRFQRERDDDGYVLANEDDFDGPYQMICRPTDAVEVLGRLSRREREFLELLEKHPEGLSGVEAARILKVSSVAISHIVNGRSGESGLLGKIPGFCVEDVTEARTEGDGWTRYVRKKLYTIDGTRNRFSEYASAVKLNP